MLQSAMNRANQLPARYLYLIGLVLNTSILASCRDSETQQPIRDQPPPLSTGLDLQTQYQKSYPKYIIEGDSLGGLCIEILRQVERESGLSIAARTREFTPFKRLQKHLATGEIDVFFGMKKNAERMRKYHFIEPPLYQVSSTIAQLADDPIQIRSLEDLDGQAVLTPRATATAAKLQREYPNLTVDASGDIFACLKKLLHKRARFVVYHDIGLISAIRAMDLQSQVHTNPISLESYDHYLVSSHNLDPEKRDRLQAALNRLTKSGELAKILFRYNQN